MLAIGIIIWFVFVLLIQIIVHDLRRELGPPLLKNISNVSLSSLVSDTQLYSWLLNSPKSEGWKVPHSQHSENSFAVLERRRVDPNAKSEFDATIVYGFSKVTKEQFLNSLLSRTSVEVEPDWSVVLGAFKYYAEDNWKNYLYDIGLPYLITLLLGAMSETVTISKILKDGERDTKEIGKVSINALSGTTTNNFELLVETYSWPMEQISQFRLGEPTLEHDVDGSDSVTTYFFTTPRLLIQDKIRFPWNITSILHFDEQGLNLTMIERERMVMTTRYLCRIE